MRCLNSCDEVAWGKARSALVPQHVLAYIHIFFTALTTLFIILIVAVSSKKFFAKKSIIVKIQIHFGLNSLVIHYLLALNSREISLDLVNLNKIVFLGRLRYAY